LLVLSVISSPYRRKRPHTLTRCRPFFQAFATPDA
jgi:hypothetical protein